MKADLKLGEFNILAVDGRARTGVFSTAHGRFETPAFMPVGTQATVKSVNPAQLSELGAQIVLANTYHLYLRPGDELIRDLGGLHQFMNWSGPILTDSGGYQVFSLAGLRKVSDHSVVFQSHLDGASVEFTPEKVVQIQENLGVDIMMVLDECVGYPAEREKVIEALERTRLWAERSQAARRRKETLAFGIMQGGMFKELRERSAQGLVELGFDGYAIGGLSVGEPNELLHELTEFSTALLPENKVRYLMGVGAPSDIVRAVRSGIDLFDCVIPTRSARFGRLYTSSGYINIRNASFRADARPVEEGCDCYCCREFSRAYVSHLIHAKEILGVQLATLHNLRFYQRLMEDIRSAIKQHQFVHFADSFLAKRADWGNPAE